MIRLAGLAPVAEEESARSAWEIHRGHILLLAAWFVVVAAVMGVAKLRARRSTGTRSRAMPRSPWLWAAAAANVVSAVIHLAVIREHFEESLLYGTFFVVLAAAQLGWAAWLVARPSVPLFAAGGAASLLVAALWLATRTVGIPLGPEAGEKEAFGSLDIVASAAELAVAILAAVAVWTLATMARTARGRARATA